MGTETVLGIFAGFLSSGGWALANAAAAKARIEDEVTVKELRASGRGGYRTVELFRARLESLRGHGTDLVNLGENDYNQFEMNSGFLIRHNIGLFGWKYAVGPLDIQPLKPRIDQPPQSGTIDSAREEGNEHGD